MGSEIRAGDTSAGRPLIHYRPAPALDAACGVPPGAPFAKEWRYVTCAPCLELAPPGAVDKPEPG